MILLSWQLSAFTALAWRGAPGTYEGVMVLLAYVILAASATALEFTPVQITVRLGTLGVGLVGVAGWGLPKVFGVHPLLFPWAQQDLLGIDP